MPDRALGLAARQLAEQIPVAVDAVWLHLSGAAPWQLLQVPGGASELAALHPLAALPDPLDLDDADAAARPLRGATYAVAGTPRAAAQAQALVALLGGPVVAVADAAVTVVATGVKVTAKAVGAVASAVIPGDKDGK